MGASARLSSGASEVDGTAGYLRGRWTQASWLRGELRSLIERDLVDPVLQLSRAHADHISAMAGQAASIERMLSS